MAIGCAPMAASASGCTLRGIVRCTVSADGTYFLPGIADGATVTGSGSGMACDDALAAKVSAAKTCATSD